MATKSEMEALLLILVLLRCEILVLEDFLKYQILRVHLTGQVLRHETSEVHTLLVPGIGCSSGRVSFNFKPQAKLESKTEQRKAVLSEGLSAFTTSHGRNLPKQNSQQPATSKKKKLCSLLKSEVPKERKKFLSLPSEERPAFRLL